MIVHLFPKSQFTEEFILFINRYFSTDEHLFVIYTNKKFLLPQELYKLNNVIDMDKKSIIWLFERLRKADKIILHNLGVNIDVLFLFFVFRNFLKKTAWLIWGADLYCYREPHIKKMDKFVEYMRQVVISRIALIATLTDGDYELAQKWYNAKGKNVRVNYCEIKSIELLKNIQLQKKKRTMHDQLNIIIGNSATKTNNHEEILNLLERFREENIKVYAPLSYGDMSYAKMIERKGEECLGDKFVPIRQFMTKEEYYHWLSMMDIGIFNNDRQQAIGNITALLFLNTKIYMRDNTSMWDEWTNKLNYKIHNMRSLDRESFVEFSSRDVEELDFNVSAVSRYFSIEDRKQEWEALFNMKLS